MIGILILLSEKFILPNINREQNAITNHMNKARLNEIAEKHGFLVPLSQIINCQELAYNNFELLTFKLVFPCIIKPLQSIDISKSFIKINRTETELIENLKIYQTHCKEVLVQEYIEIDSEIGVQGFASKHIVVSGVVEKIRKSTIAPGSTTYARLVPSNYAADEDKIVLMVKDLGYVGIFDMEFMSSNNKVYFIEMNFRNGAYGYAFTKAGVNLPKLWCLDILGEDITDEKQRADSTLIFMNEFAELRNVLLKQVSLWRWLKDFLKSDASLLFNTKDVKPFFYKLLMR